jgi:hypothetical protein
VRGRSGSSRNHPQGNLSVQICQNGWVRDYSGAPDPNQRMLKLGARPNFYLFQYKAYADLTQYHLNNPRRDVRQNRQVGQHDEGPFPIAGFPFGDGKGTHALHSESIKYQ